MEKGKLPVTGKIVIETSLIQLAEKSGNYQELKTTGIIEKEPGVKVRVQIVITCVCPLVKTHFGKMSSPLSFDIRGEKAREIRKIADSFVRKAFEKIRVFCGYINGENKIPIMIMHFVEMNYVVYTQEKVRDACSVVFPDNPQMN